MLENLIRIQSIFLLSAFIANLGLSFYIFFKKRTSEINRSFSFMLFGIAFWTLSSLLFLVVNDLNWVLFIRRLTPVGSSILSGYFLYFALLFPRINNPLPRFQRYLILAPGYFFALSSVLTPYMIQSLRVPDIKYPFLGIPQFGILYKLYAVYFTLYLFAAIAVLIYKFAKSKGREKLQIWYVLFGTTISGVAGISLSLFLPLLHVSQFFTLGPLFTLILVSFIVYAIEKHKLLGIEDFLIYGMCALFCLLIFVGTLVSILSNQIGFIPTFYLISIQIALGFLVYIRNRRSEINLSFSLFSFSFALWNYFSHQVTQRTILGATFYDKYIFVVAAFFMMFFLYFTYVFPEKKPTFSTMRRVLLFIFPLTIFLLVPFNLIIKDVLIKDAVVTPIFGAAYPIFVIFTLGYVVLGLYNLISNYFISRGGEKLQIRYVFLGMSLSFISLIITNVVFPWFGEARLAPFGSLFTLFFVAFSAYAILKHRLMSIEFVIQKGFIYATITAIIMSAYALSIFLSEQTFRGILGYSSLIITGVVALLIAVTFQPLVRVLQNITDKVFFSDRYDYQSTLREASHNIATQLRLEDLSTLIVSTFMHILRVSEISFLVLDRERSKFRSVPVDVAEGRSCYKRIEIEEHSPIANRLESSKDIILFEELEDEIARRESFGKEEEGYFKELQEVKAEIERLGIDLWVPILSKDELIGIIALGYKLSGDIYTSEDLVLLMTLANQAAVALENARLYEEVLSAKDYTQDVLEAMVSGVITLDTRGQIITFNPMSEKITGIAAKDALNKNYKEIFSENSDLNFILDNALNGKSYFNYEANIVSNKIGLVPVSLSSSLLRDPNGKKTGALVTISDLTEVKSLESKVRQADKIGALGTMAAGMAHEIKNPLSSMKVLSQLFPLKFNDEEFRGKFMEIMPREIARIDRIVESLLGFARAASPKFVPVDIKELIEDDIKYFTEQAKNSKVKIIAEYAELPLVDGDPDQLSQVFSNLILNAIQAMPEGGELRIRAREGKKIENILQNVEVESSDSGHGISEDNLKKLFDPFFTTKYAGTGLGLTISHSIIDGHKGTIDVKSQIGKGTVFTVALPVKQDLL